MLEKYLLMEIMVVEVRLAQLLFIFICQELTTILKIKTEISSREPRPNEDLSRSRFPSKILLISINFV